MSNQESKVDYVNLQGFIKKEKEEEEEEEEEEVESKSLLWVLLSCIACLCFALSAYILGILSVGGVTAKFLNSWGYLLISLIILATKNVKFARKRTVYFRDHPLETNSSVLPSLRDSCYYNTDTDEYKWLGFFLSFVCGALNFLGEICIILSFQHALDSLMNQGILTSLFTLGAIVVLVGGVILLKEHVRFCEVSINFPKLYSTLV
jgi:glucose uptake protein GlcU